MLRHDDLKALAELRLKEAEALHRAGLYDGCVYLCGYVMEMALKACVCKALNIPEYPDTGSDGKFFKTHEFKTLLLLAGLRDKFEADQRASQVFRNKCSVALGWKPDLRYQVGLTSEGDSLDQLEALRSTSEGVYTWLANRW